MPVTQLHIRFHGDLPGLVSVPHMEGFLHHDIERRASVKDVIESLGVPHSEVGRLLVNEADADFSAIMENGDRIEVFPHEQPVDVTRATLLRPAPLDAVRFLVDVNVGKLALLLRMLGFDAAYYPECDDGRLAEIAGEERRILLSRDVSLMKRKAVVHGRLVRQQDPKGQLAEVVWFYGLAGCLMPCSRCLLCNRELVPVEKEKVLHRLEPLTRKYYNIFHHCPDCDRIYWHGSHREGMEEYLKSIRLGDMSGGGDDEGRAD